MSSEEPPPSLPSVGSQSAQDSSSADLASQSKDLKNRGKSDPAWEYCIQVLDEGRKKLRCCFCSALVAGGGIHRFKLHLAGIPGQIKSCGKVPAEVRYTMKAHVNEYDERKRKHEEAFAEENPYGPNVQQQESEKQSGEAAPATRANTKAKKSTVPSKDTPEIGKFFMPRTNPGDQPTIRSVLQNEKARNRVDLIMNKWFIDASLPFNATTSKYYQPMLDAVASYGPGYKGPSSYVHRGPLLVQNVEETKKYVEGYRKIWKDTGCTIMSDGWTDGKRRTLINFLVYCPQGMVFLKSVDATDSSKTGEYLFRLFASVVQFVGPENVVHFVTDNASNMRAAGKRLEEEFPSLYWSPCAAHCLNLMLTDIGKIEVVERCVQHASRITKYLYNHCYPLYLMRKFTNGKEILRPAPTRFATNFVALQSIYKQKDALRAMVVSKEWRNASCSKDAKGKKFVSLVMDQSFWKDCAIVCQISEPLVRVLRIVDSDERPAMGYLFASLHAAKEEIEKRFQRRKIVADKVLEKVLEIIDAQWDKHLVKNLHAAGFWFNPVNQYNDSLISKYHVTTSGVIDVIEKYAGKDSNLRVSLTSEMKIFRQADGDFGRATAINDRATMLPDEWWLTYGCSAPHLQKLAIRVLSQTCSASGCERNWSLFEHIHSKKRNRLEHQRMNDIVYVHYNQRLQQRSKLHSRNFDPISLEDISKFNEEWIVEEDPARLTAEEVDTFRKDLTSVARAPDCNDRVEELEVDDADIDDPEENEEEASIPAGDIPNDHHLYSCEVGPSIGDTNERWPSTVDWNMDHY